MYCKEHGIVNWKGYEYSCVANSIPLCIIDTLIPPPFVYHKSFMEERFIVMLLLLHYLGYEDEKEMSLATW